MPRRSRRRSRRSAVDAVSTIALAVPVPPSTGSGRGGVRGTALLQPSGERVEPRRDVSDEPLGRRSRASSRRADPAQPRCDRLRRPHPARQPGRDAAFPACCARACFRPLEPAPRRQRRRPSPGRRRGPSMSHCLRLPKAKDEQEMAVHACLSVLAPGGRLIVYGGNDEGIRSAAGMIERLCGGVETLATRGHGRVLAAHRPADPVTAARLAGGVALDDVARDRRQQARLGLLPRHLRGRPHRRGHRAADRGAATVACRRPRARLRMRIGRDRRRRGSACTRHRAGLAGQ